MSVSASADDLVQGYEALRAEAVGERVAIGPHGRAVLLRGGLVAWMRALPPTKPSARSGPATHDEDPALVPSGVRRELVDVLTTMALGSGRRRCRAS